MLRFVGILVVLLVSPSSGIHCDADIDLDDVTEYEYTMPGEPLDDRKYWRTFNMNYQVFGKFSGKSPITAGLYTAEDKLIYSITVDCASKKWKSELIDPDDESDTVTTWLEGDLESECTSGAEFDIWLKVHQPFMMSWIFDGQALQHTTQITYNSRGGGHKKSRIRPLNVPGKYESVDATVFRVKSSNGAILTRMTFGQCISWPYSLTKDCWEARKWISNRSKLAGAYEDVQGKGKFGANLPIFSPACYLDSKYYNFVQTSIHPDRNSHGKSYCCCVTMDTGEITLKANGEIDCDIGDAGGSCDKSCSRNVVNEYITEAIKASNEKENM